jgi:peptide deformylase
MKELVAPHKIACRQVMVADIPQVIADAEDMKKFLKGGCMGLAHPQVEDKEPLAFFVDKERGIIVNPEITKHSAYTRDSVEGCMTFLRFAGKIVQRWQKCEVDYSTISEGALVKTSESLTGADAILFQHEIDHINSIYIYD